LAAVSVEACVSIGPIATKPQLRIVLASGVEYVDGEPPLPWLMTTPGNGPVPVGANSTPSSRYATPSSVEVYTNDAPFVAVASPTRTKALLAQLTLGAVGVGGGGAAKTASR
jgi:hypothetical protein